MTRPGWLVLLDPRFWWALASESRAVWRDSGGWAGFKRERARAKALFDADPRPREVKLAEIARALEESVAQVARTIAGQGEGTCVRCGATYRCNQAYRFTAGRPCPSCGEAGLASYRADLARVTVRVDPS